MDPPEPASPAWYCMLGPEYWPGPAGLAPLEPGIDPPDIKFTPEATGTPYWGATPEKD